LILLAVSLAPAQWLESTIYLPDSSFPYALCYNPTNNKVYCANYYGDSVTVIDGATNGVITTVAVGGNPNALCYNPTDNKVYCANFWSNNVTVIDGATNGVIATVAAGDSPWAFCHNPTNNKVYCANYNSNNVTVIDGATNGVITTIPVGRRPVDFCHNPAQNRVYVADYYGSSISVLRDSGGWIEESFKPHAASFKPEPTIVRGVLLMPTASGMLLDIAGREVLALNAGVNNIGGLAPGVYFVRPEHPAENDGPSAVTKVVIQR